MATSDLTERQLIDALSASDAWRDKQQFLSSHLKADSFCGFAWVVIRLRKNQRLGKVLLARGWRWDEFNKVYTLSLGGESQSMSYREAIAGAYADTLKQHGVPASVSSRVD